MTPRAKGLLAATGFSLVVWAALAALARVADVTRDNYRLTNADVVEARQLMRSGLCLKETADRMDVLSGDLDLAIWKAFGRKDQDLLPARKHQPDF